MYKLIDIEKQLRSYLSASVLRQFSRSVTKDAVILSANSHHELSVSLLHDCICIHYADEHQYFHYSDDMDISDVLESIGIFINELMTGTLIYERIYYGRVQTKCRVTLVNRISRRRVHLRDTVISSGHTKNAPKLVLHEKIFFI